MALLTIAIASVDARVLTASSLNEHLAHKPSASIQLGDHYELTANDHIEHQRYRREAFYDPYAVYYYYPTSYNPQPIYYQSYINRRDTDDNRITEKGQKYKYTPLFQYKSTQSRRRKLFVPNLFG